MVEGLGRSISAPRNCNYIKGLCGTNGGDRNTHEDFVDDTMLMGYPSMQETRIFKQCLDQFGEEYGLEVNAKKYHGLFSNTPSITHRNICCI